MQTSPLLLLRMAVMLLALSACAHPPPPPPEQPPPSPALTSIPEAERKALSGTWVYAGGNAELLAVNEAVERATADMGFLARGFAAEALRARARPREHYTLSFEGPTVTITSSEHPPETGTVGGPPVNVTDKFGHESLTSFLLRDGALVAVGKSADGSGETVFIPSADGQTLKVRRLMQSSRLTAPVDVTLSYRRQD